MLQRRRLLFDSLSYFGIMVSEYGGVSKNGAIVSIYRSYPMYPNCYPRIKHSNTFRQTGKAISVDPREAAASDQDPHYLSLIQQF